MAEVNSFENAILGSKDEPGADSRIDELPFPAWISDSKGERLFVNSALRRFIGCQEFEVNPNELADKIHPDDRAQWLNCLSEIILTGVDEAFTIDYRICHHSGCYRWVFDRIRRVAGPKGTATRLQGFVVDIHERKEFELFLGKSREHYENFYRGARVGLFCRSLYSGQMIECNEYFAHMFEYDSSVDLLSNFRFSESYVEPDVLNFVNEQLAVKGEINNFRARLRAKNGRIIWIEFCEKLDRESGHIEGLAFDVTGIVESEQNVLQLSKAVEQSPVSIVITDVSGNIEYVNPKFKDLTGYEFDEVIGKNPSILKSGHYTADDYKKLWDTILSGQEWAGEFLNRNKAGELFWESAKICPIKDSNGVTTHFLAVKEDITERKAGQKRIQEQINFIQSLIDSIPTPVFYKDKNHRYIGCNKAFAEFLGFPKDDILGKTVLEMPSDVDPKLHYKIDQELLMCGGTRQYESTLKTASGELRQLKIFKATYDDGSGNIAGIIGSFFDISEQKLLEKALRYSRDFLQSVIDAVGDPIFVKDEQHRHVLDNEALCRFLGHSKEELSGHTDYDYLPSEQADIFWNKDKIVLTSGVENVNEEQLKNASGEIRTIVTKKNLYISPEGNKYIVGVIRDITEMRKAEMELRESQEKFRLIAGTAAEAIVVIDNQTRVVFWNKAAEEIYGYSEAEALGKDFIGLLFPQDEPEVRRILTGAGDYSQLGRTFDITVRKKDGSAVPIEMSIGGMQEKDRQQIVCIARDMSEIQRSRAQLIQTDKLAAIGTLAAGVAHEINNPIGYVSSNLKTMAKYLTEIKKYFTGTDSKDASAQQSMLDIMSDFDSAIKESLEGVARVRKIVLDLKTFSRADSLEREYADINAGIESTLNIVWNELKYRCRVEKQMEALPKLLCIPNQINQVILNLLVNAGQAITHESGRIKIKTWSADNQIFISIKDNGTGIPQADLKRIFEPFFTTKEVGKGTGLGLSLAYDIVKKHGGQIEVKSEVGKGSEFIVSFPIKTDEYEQA